MSKKIMFLLSLFTSIQLMSQKDSLQSHALDEVIVTANKQEQKQSTTGKVITVISKEQLEKSNGKTLTQILNEATGITINGAYNNIGTNQSVFMRGAATGRTLILLDGIPVNDPSQITNEFDLNLFSINEVERIEICKGAQSTIYGSDAIAGVINIITVKQQIQKSFNGKTSFSAGKFNTYKGNLQFYGKIKKLTYTVRSAFLHTDGFSSAHDSTGIKQFDKDSYKGYWNSAAIQYKISEQLNIKAFGMYSAYKAGIDDGIFKDDRYFFIHNNLLNTGGGFQYKTHGISITGNYQFSEMNRNYERDSLDKLVSSYFLRNNYFGKTQFAELYANIPINKNIGLLQGFEYRYSNMNNHYFSVSKYGPYEAGFADTNTNQLSAYSSVLINTKKGFATDLGMRINRHSKYGTNTTFTFNPSYRASDHVRIFGSVASGFKAPSLYQLFDQFSGRPELKPEKSITVEMGYANKCKIFSDRLVVFYRDIKHGIDYDFVRGQYFNFTKQTAIGIEYEANVRVNDRLSVTGNFNWISIYDSTQSRINFKDTGYAYGLRRPGINTNLSVQYQQNHLYFSVSGKYVSSRYDIGGYKKADVNLQGYFILNANGSYQLNKQLRFFIDAQNITGKTFFDLRGFNSIPSIFNAGCTIEF